MKLSSFLLLVTVLQAWAVDSYSQHTKLTLDLKNVTVKDALKTIEDQSEFLFLYSPKMVDVSRKVDIELTDKKVDFILNQMFAGTGVDYIIKDRQIVITTDEMIQPFKKETPQQIIVTGKVTDEDGQTLPGVNIVVKGTMKGTISDVDGNYTLQVDSQDAILVFSFVGHRTQEVIVGNQTQIDVTLGTDIIGLEEVVSIGYGVQKKLSLTNSVSQMSGEDITKRPVANVSQSLQGMASGVFVIDKGGRPGDTDVNIRIRGITTLGNSSPLIIVDGIEQELSDINPDDIENISILKDASSTAIYGSRAANGVIIVNTKRAKEGDVNISYHGYYGIQRSINRPKHMDLRSYFELENVARLNVGSAALYSEEFINEYVNATDREKYPLPFPWFDKGVMLKNGPQQNHTFSISGGSKRLKGRASLRYQNIDGVVNNYNNEIAEIRLNSDYKATEKLNFSIDLNYRRSKDIQPASDQNPFQYMLHASKFSYPKYESGEYGLGPQNNNPLLFVDLAGLETSKNDYLFGKIKGDYEIFTGLNYSVELGLRNSNIGTSRFSNKYSNQDPITGRVRSIALNYLREERSGFSEYTFTHLLNYVKSIKHNNMKVLLGNSIIGNKQNSLWAYRENFYNNNVQSIDQGSNENKNNGGGNSEFGLISYFSRYNYNFKNKYFAEVNARFDGSSRFSSQNQYAFFPSFSVAWRISQESFWSKFNSVVNELKLRGSYGLTGNQAISLYEFYPALSIVNYAFNESSIEGYTQTQFVNNDLKWEKTSQLDFGIDVGLWENKLNLTLDYYDKVTNDILLRLPIPSTVGLSPSFQNAGVVKNSGWEANINYKGGDEFTYNIGFNINKNKNKVVDLLGTGPYISGSGENGTYIIKEGLAINSLWGYHTDGFFQSEEEIANYPTYQANTKPGDTKYLDLNNDGKITPDDRGFLGNSFPSLTFGSNMAFSYQNFELFIQWQGAAGHATHVEGGLGHLATYEAFTPDVYTDYWTPENRDSRWPRPEKFNVRNLQASDIKIINADYIRLKNIVLSYRFQGNLLNKLSLQDAKIYINATNLLSFSKLNEWHLDPEMPSGRLDYYPQIGLYTIGVILNFK